MQVKLETSRLLLRLPNLSDLEPWAAMMTDAETARFIGGVAPREVTWRALMTMIGSWHALGFGMFSARRLGSVNRGAGRLPPPFHNHPIDIWGQTRDEWRARSKNGAARS